MLTSAVVVVLLLLPAAAIASQISIQHDTSKLKKHISNICEKLVKVRLRARVKVGLAVVRVLLFLF